MDDWMTATCGKEIKVIKGKATLEEHEESCDLCQAKLKDLMYDEYSGMNEMLNPEANR